MEIWHDALLLKLPTYRLYPKLCWIGCFLTRSSIQVVVDRSLPILTRSFRVSHVADFCHPLNFSYISKAAPARLSLFLSLGAISKCSYENLLNLNATKTQPCITKNKKNKIFVVITIFTETIFRSPRHSLGLTFTKILN